MWRNGDDTFEPGAGETARLTVGGATHVLHRAPSAGPARYQDAEFWALVTNGGLVGTLSVLAGRTGEPRGRRFEMPMRDQLRMNAEAHGVELSEAELDAEVARVAAGD